MQPDVPSLDIVDAPTGIPSKSPEQRRAYRQSSFERYFQSARVHEIRLNAVALHIVGPVSLGASTGHLVGLGNEHGMDSAIGIIESDKPEPNVLLVRSPLAATQPVRRITVGCSWTDSAP